MWSSRRTQIQLLEESEACIDEVNDVCRISGRSWSFQLMPWLALHGTANDDWEAGDNAQALHGSIAGGGGGYDAAPCCSVGRRPQHTRDIL
jgi:hypothetical protein